MPPTIPKSRVHLLAARIHALGPRPLAELFLELFAGADPLDRIERYSILDPTIVAAVGARDLPARVRALR